MGERRACGEPNRDGDFGEELLSQESDRMRSRITTRKVIQRDFQKVMNESAEDVTRSSVVAALRRWWFQMIYEITDRELQRRTWLDPARTDPHWSYLAFVSSFPGVEGLDDTKRCGLISPEEHAIMIDLSTAVHCHKAPGGNVYDSAAVLDDPAWHAVTAKADFARRRLLDLTKDASERQELRGRGDLH